MQVGRSFVRRLPLSVRLGLLAEREVVGGGGGEVMNVLFEKRGVQWNAMGCVYDTTTKCWTLRLHMVTMRVYVQLGNVQNKAFVCFRWISNRKGANLLWRKWKTLYSSLFAFFTPKQADKPKAKTNVANNGLKIVSCLTTSRAWVCISILYTHKRVIVSALASVSESMYANVCTCVCILKWKLLT